MFRLPSWKHHWNPSSFPQVHELTKGRPRNATHESRPVDAQESRALRNPVQSNSWVHEFRWEFLGEIMENHGKLSWENHGKSMGNDGNLFSGHLFLDEIPHVKKYGIPSTSPRGRTRCLPYAKKKHLLFIHHFWRWNPPLPLAQCISSCFKQFKTICCSSLKFTKCWTCWPYTRISRINSCISKTWKLKSLKTRPWKTSHQKEKHGSWNPSPSPIPISTFCEGASSAKAFAIIARPLPFKCPACRDCWAACDRAWSTATFRTCRVSAGSDAGGWDNILKKAGTMQGTMGTMLGLLEFPSIRLLSCEPLVTSPFE